jgi:hypothetical protein
MFKVLRAAGDICNFTCKVDARGNSESDVIVKDFQ